MYDIDFDITSKANHNFILSRYILYWKQFNRLHSIGVTNNHSYPTKINWLTQLLNTIVLNSIIFNNQVNL